MNDIKRMLFPCLQPFNTDIGISNNKKAVKHMFCFYCAFNFGQQMFLNCACAI